MLNVNEENINGEFYVSSMEELKMQAIKYLVLEREYDQEDVEDIELEIRFKEAGLYAFWGLDFIGEYMLAHITEIFETETGANPLIFLEDEKVIENERRKWYERGNFVYAVWNRDSELIRVCYNDEKEDEEAILKSLIMSYGEYDYNYNEDDSCFYISDYELEKFRRSYFITELRELDDYRFYEFLKQYSEREWLL